MSGSHGSAVSDTPAVAPTLPKRKVEDVMCRERRDAPSVQEYGHEVQLVVEAPMPSSLVADNK